jgi:stearoyl-CoA desaturase (delta-9 desaturase)
MNLGLPLLLGLLHGDIWGSLFLAGFLRLVLSQHFTYLINSAAHIWGQRSYDPNQTARDNWFIALFTFGEGYHNYHHTFAWDYRNGIKWYHYDPTKWLIKVCSWLRLASDLRFCSNYRVELTRLAVQYNAALEKCELLIEPANWRDTIEHEYSQLVDALNQWSQAKQAWYQARSTKLSVEIQHDLELLQSRYKALRSQLHQQKQNWHSLLHSFSHLQTS